MCVTSRAISVRVIRALPLACIRDLPQCSRTCHTVLTTHHSAHHTSSFFFTLYLEPVSGAQIRASRYGPIHIRASCPIYGARNKQGPYLVRKRGPSICSACSRASARAWPPAASLWLSYSISRPIVHSGFSTRGPLCALTPVVARALSCTRASARAVPSAASR